LQLAKKVNTNRKSAMQIPDEPKMNIVVAPKSTKGLKCKTAVF